MHAESRKTAVFSFFAGVGFLDLGFELQGQFEIAYVNEFTPEFAQAYEYARRTLNLNSPKFGFGVESAEAYLIDPAREEYLQRAIAKYRKQGRTIGFVAGPPCPDFSVGGKNRGRHGDHGRLSQVYADLVTHFQPDFFVFENVKGLWLTKKHREFYEELKRTFRSGGYELTERLLNARWYGAPQDRDRIMLIGFKDEDLQNHISQFPWSKNWEYTDAEVRAVRWPQQETFIEDQERRMPAGILEDLTVQYWFDKNEVNSHPNANDYFQPRAGLAKFKTIDEGDDKKKSFKRLHRWRYSPTVAYGNNEVHLHPFKARRISVAEALSLQSLPREFEILPCLPLSAKFKMIGNGVPFLLARGVADSITSFMEEYGDESDSERFSASHKQTA